MIEPGDSMQWWVDSSYTIHPDMNSSYGIVMTLGKESHTPHHANRNQTEINTKSSTEAELVAIDDAMGQILWTRQFLVSQGMAIPTITIYQDHKSTVLLTENGTTASSKCTKHLDV